MIRRLSRKQKCLAAFLFAAVLLLVSVGLYRLIPPEPVRFERYTRQLLEDSLLQDTLTLHYTLADPDGWGLEPSYATLGSFPDGDAIAQAAMLENQYAILDSFHSEDLRAEQALTLDILKTQTENELALMKGYFLQNFISPSLGTQAQLPTLLAEYAFRSKGDIDTYFALLEDLDRYFSDLMDFVDIQAANGVGPEDNTIDRICEQCEDFIGRGDASHFLQAAFVEKCSSCDFLSDDERQSLADAHAKQLTDCVFPAYRNLMERLKSLQGTCKVQGGLATCPNGTDYYEALVRKETGSSLTIPQIQERLYRQLLADIQKVQSLPQDTASGADPYEKLDAAKMLQLLQNSILNDFPALTDVDWELKQIQDELADYASPAFYLTPPIDAQETNTIYINPTEQMSGVELFSTLAHEGFPGHLYQTNYFSSTDPDPLREVLSCGGYIEGWATYVESWFCTEAEGVWSGASLYWLERSMNLCLTSLLDIGIHGHGWSLADVGSFLDGFGISDQAAVQNLYQYILENPTNYLKYYLGYLSFADLRTACENALGDAFDLRAFHEAVLTTGPCPFDILEDEVFERLDISQPLSPAS
ncbi:MAG TPA: DUF885 domain-containing protein [Lachnospiraceae bacterium]|nr:DUF885 domain-containing protein [Lachnospiraceae bacterium]